MIETTRRQFLTTVAAAGAAMAFTKPAAAQTTLLPVCVFSKHLHFIEDYSELGKTAKAIGVDGLDLTVRAGGHVEPGTVAADLPRAVEAIRAEGVDVNMITTGLKSGHDPDAKPILEAASKLGIRYARIGNHKYTENGDILKELDAFTGEVKRLGEVLAACNMVGGYHNHSGAYNVGGPLWDLHRMITSIGMDCIGSNFDVGHAMAEGAAGAWRANTQLMAPHVKMMSIKDFDWENSEPKWGPLGKGCVQTVDMLKIVRAAGFAGPLSLHFEYKVSSRDAILEEMRAAAITLRGYLAEAGYA
ncbi:MAG: sugar phosphate isomerase/epimerase [Candidatus Hydrogenedentes bacterium]|nr:sugar phosphate isomerase/epimerase [Candidatus Hydrogenedentota bacterium]